MSEETGWTGTGHGELALRRSSPFRSSGPSSLSGRPRFLDGGCRILGGGCPSSSGRPYLFGA